MAQSGRILESRRQGGKSIGGGGRGVLPPCDGGGGGEEERGEGGGSGVPMRGGSAEMLPRSPERLRLLQPTDKPER